MLDVYMFDVDMLTGEILGKMVGKCSILQEKLLFYYLNTQILKYPNTQIPKYPNTQIPKYPNTQILVFLNKNNPLKRFYPISIFDFSQIFIKPHKPFHTPTTLNPLTPFTYSFA